VAGVALGHIHLRFVWQAWHLWHWAGVWWRAWARLDALAHRCVTGVALGDISLGFAWQAWHLATSNYLGFAWQAWHLVTSTFVLRGRRGIHGIGLALVARLGVLGHAWSPATPLNFAWQAWHLATTLVLHGRRGTWRHLSSFRVAGVALGDIYLGFAWQAWHLVTATFVLRGRCGAS